VRLPTRPLIGLAWIVRSWSLSAGNGPVAKFRYYMDTFRSLIGWRPQPIPKGGQSDICTASGTRHRSARPPSSGSVRPSKYSPMDLRSLLLSTVRPARRLCAPSRCPSGSVRFRRLNGSRGFIVHPSSSASMPAPIKVEAPRIMMGWSEWP
jgi:hypothetical protein